MHLEPIDDKKELDETGSNKSEHMHLNMMNLIETDISQIEQIPFNSNRGSGIQINKGFFEEENPYGLSNGFPIQAKPIPQQLPEKPKERVSATN